jgi:hypothetical protein
MKALDKIVRAKILIIYYHYRGYPLRATTRDYLYSFERYSGFLCYYVNLAFGFPGYLSKVDFDLIIFTDSFLSKRNLLKFFTKAVKECQEIKKFRALKIAMPQDEFYYTDVLNQFINEFGIDHIFSVSPPSEWGKIYPSIDRGKVKMDQVLTGYIDDAVVDFYRELCQKNPMRDIDIGYRSTPLRFSLGWFGYLKGRIAEVFNEKSPKYHLKTDISTQPQDTKLGMEWYKFLSRCKYFIGVESGASLLDPDGAIYHRVNAYVDAHPDANFEEVERNCFPELDGNIELFALGPRHLEACVARSCQILVEGNYNGLLKAGIHYIPLKRDFSNIDEVLEIVKKDELREKIVEQAYQDIVASEKWTYREMVNKIIDKCFPDHTFLSKATNSEKRAYNQNKKREEWIWRIIPVQSWIINFFISMLPTSLMSRII